MKESRFFQNFEEQNRRGTDLFTVNLVPGKQVYDEKLLRIDNKEYREWNPRKSKLAAAILKGIGQIGVRPGQVVLYLGASSGTTPSHVSDILGKDGFMFALDFAPRVVRDLVFLCEERKNMCPLLADANKPEEYLGRVCEVDFLYQDIAQRNQAEIFMKNVDLFLKKDGFAMLCVKARSVDVTADPNYVYKKIKADLEKKYTMIDWKKLDPFERDHCVFLIKKK